MDTFTLLTTLPHHSKMGMFENPKSAPAWEAQHGHRFSTEQLIAVAGELMDHAAANTNVEWGDVRSRHINSMNASFLRFVAALRTS